MLDLKKTAKVLWLDAKRAFKPKTAGALDMSVKEANDKFKGASYT